MKNEIIVFHWADASMHGTDQKTKKEWEKSGLIHGIVAGHIVSETKTHFNIAMDLFFKQHDIDEDNYRQVASYPKSGIIKIIKRFEVK